MSSCKLLFVVAFFAIFTTLHASEYYYGFTENLGMDAYISDHGHDCAAVVSVHVDSLKSILQTRIYDSNALYLALADFMDMLRYELHPQCSMLYGEFVSFLVDTYADTNQIEAAVETNLKKYHREIIDDINFATAAFTENDGYTAGEIHIHLLKLVLGFEITAPLNIDQDFEEDEIVSGYIEQDPEDMAAEISSFGPTSESEIFEAPMPILKRVLQVREMNLDL